MRSMTGFGRAEMERGGTRVAVEIRTLNQRFLELKLNLPRAWGEYEAEIRKLVQGAVARGRVELFVRSTIERPAPTTVRVNDELAAVYVAELGRLGRLLGLGGKPGIESLLHRPEIFHVSEEESDWRPAVALALEAIARALKALNAEREREGKALKADFVRRIATISSALPRIEKLAKNSRKEIIALFRSRVQELAGDLPNSEKRLLEAAADTAQRADIAEEITRLQTHLQGMRELINRPGPSGKSIEFLLQEVNREVNTIGAKSQDAALSRLVIDLKGEAEKMREQVQNVE